MTMMKLCDQIDKDKLNWNTLSCNPNAIELLRENQDKINRYNLSENPNAIKLLRKKPKKLIGKRCLATRLYLHMITNK